MSGICHGQLIQQRMICAFNRRVKARLFGIGLFVLKNFIPHQDEYKEKFTLNYQRPYIVHKALSGDALVLSKMDGQEWPTPIKLDSLKR